MIYIIGSDEAGTGACAGSAVFCAVKAPIDWNLKGLADSKKLSAKKREELAAKILEEYKARRIRYSLLEISAAQIDKDGLAHCIKFGHQCVINNLADEFSAAIVDGKLNIQAKCETKALVKADTQIPTVMAAAILAKTYRDNLMKKMHQKYPAYGWDKNFGYVVAQHKEAIKVHGFSDMHRRSYKLKDV